MAHLITGLDVGAHSVKFVCIDAGFRRSNVVDTFEIPVPAGEASLEDRQLDAIQAGLARLPGESVVYTAIAGGKLSVRLLELPFADARKVEQVVPFELEGQLVQPLEEVIFDHVILPSDEDKTWVLAVAARLEDVGGEIERLKGLGVSPRALFAAPAIYEARPQVVEPVLEEAPVETGEADGPRADLSLLLDVGHAKTNIVVLKNGRPLYARTVPRGGQHLTAAIAAGFNASYEMAEEAKRARAVVAHPAFAATDEFEARTAAILQDALAPLVRDIRQTLAGFRGLFRGEPAAFCLVGGSAGLRGLSEFLQDALGLPERPYVPGRGRGEDDGAAFDRRFALAEAIAWAGVRGDRQIDLRRGPFVYRASLSVVRQKALHLGTLAAALVVCIAVDATMSYSRLHGEQEKLQSELEAATIELFGEPRTNASEVAHELKKGFREELPPIPTRTAYDLMNEISRRTPSSDRMKLDIAELDIRPKKTFIKGTIDSVASVDELVNALKEAECFEEINKGSITEVSGGEKQFTLTIKSTCP